MAITTEQLKCAQCGDEVSIQDFLADCDECGNFIDACASCFQGHMADQHDEENEGE